MGFKRPVLRSTILLGLGLGLVVVVALGLVASRDPGEAFALNCKSDQDVATQTNEYAPGGSVTYQSPQEALSTSESVATLGLPAEATEIKGGSEPPSTGAARVDAQNNYVAEGLPDGIPDADRYGFWVNGSVVAFVTLEPTPDDRGLFVGGMTFCS